ncbi:hypothetical protein DFH09DRAFT_884504, partial [Mycena vulgaris]
CVGSDHLPIRYKFDFEPVRSVSSRYNQSKMDLDNYLAILRETLGLGPAPMITTKEQLDPATKLLCDALAVALRGSTPKHRTCSLVNRWWTPHLSAL